MNTLRPTEETWVKQGKEGPTKTYESGTSVDGLYTVVVVVVVDTAIK
jgi:hypothetical protein